MHHFRLIFIVFFLLPLAGFAQEIAPEPSSTLTNQQALSARSYMAVTAHKLASQTAVQIMEQGGSAVDAAIAAQMVLNVVEPQSSGIGGGGFLLFYNNKNQTITSFDGRETAPAATTSHLFLDDAGNPLPFLKAVKSGKAVGTPGLLAMLKMAHTQHGKLPWHQLFTPAITIAENGFAISPRLYKSIAYAINTAKPSPQFSDLFLDKTHQPKAIGNLLKNHKLAAVFKQIASQGTKAFYHGPLAQKMAHAVQQAGGNLTIEDLAQYRAKTRDTACAPYRSFTICSMGLPSSGGITLLQTLGILQHFTLRQAYSAQEIHLVLEAEKRAFADRNRYLADSDITAVPNSQALLSPHYLTARAQEILFNKATTTPAQPGVFPGRFGKDNSFDAPSTTHLSIIDSQGNAVSMTTSVEHSFGSSIMVEGFVMNNQMTDFAFMPEENGKPVANAPAPFKRPRSSMTPSMIRNADGSLYAVIGSPGGSSIIGYVIKTIIALVDWNMPLQAAINAPHFMHKNSVAEIETGNVPLMHALTEMGHHPTATEQVSGVHVIIRKADGSLLGAADPRREGVALGK